MLRLIIGGAGVGKTSAVIEEICNAVHHCEGQRFLIVPEQYSHEAERELSLRCGDTLSLYAEVFSFTGLARRMMSLYGGGAGTALDKGGRLLCMALALKAAAPGLRVYSGAERKPELQDMLLHAVDELKTACVTSEALTRASAEMNDALGDKLSDLALVLESYDAVVSRGRADPADRLTVLKSQIPGSILGSGAHVYIDGFIDFTKQELEVILAMLSAGAELTVCLTLDGIDAGSEIFELSRRAGRTLIRRAKELGTSVEVQTLSAQRQDALSFFAENLFSYTDVRETSNEQIELWRADDISAECEFAAAKAIALVRGGCRWRDIALVVRGFEDYRGTLESVFRHYKVPLFTARKSDMLSKPLPAMIDSAYEIILGGWDVDDVISYMRTGLSGLSAGECDELADYIFKWQLRAGAWQKSEPWRQHPDGYGNDYDDESRERLSRINALRHTLSAPLLKFSDASSKAESASAHAAALTNLLRDLRLPELLSERAKALRAAGRETLGAEYEQIWDICVSALEQCDAVLGASAMDAQEFSRLFSMMLSKYDIGAIPVSLDRVSAGDFDRNRRRHIKHLIVLGASDARLPSTEGDAGVFSEDDRQRLLEYDIDLGGGEEGELWREFSLIYNCLTLPSEKLIMCCPLSDANGEEQRPAFVFTRAQALFELEAKTADITDARTSAPAPAMSLAAQGILGGSGASAAAAEYFRNAEPESFGALERAAAMRRGTLSQNTVEKLYGRKLMLSASRIDKFASCRYAYFCQYGLRAKPYEPAQFRPPEIGTFMHYVLEKTMTEVKNRGGINSVTNDELKEITDTFVERYVSEELDDFREKSSRFIHLFKRICRDVHQVVCDMADELRRSSFEPLDFELDFSDASKIPPVELGGAEGELRLTGIADRVDGWVHEGKLYLRVVDYKTGKKEFSLSDVWYGMGLQMLLYLFALEECGEKRYGTEVVPAGVMYLPARNEMSRQEHRIDEAKAEAERLKALRRSGIVLNDEAVINAWEHGDDKLYIPVKSRSRNGFDGLAGAAQLGKLERHIKKTLCDMARELRSGSIAADPYYRTQEETACGRCDYYDACHFSDGENGESVRRQPTLSPERVWAMIDEEVQHE